MESNQCISTEESSGTLSSPPPASIRCLAQYKMTGERKKKICCLVVTKHSPQDSGGGRSIHLWIRATQQQPTETPSWEFIGKPSTLIVPLASGGDPLVPSTGLFKMKCLGYGCCFLGRIIYSEVVKINRALWRLAQAIIGNALVVFVNQPFNRNRTI